MDESSMPNTGNRKVTPLFADLRLARRVEAAWDFLGVQNALVHARRDPSSGAEVLAVGGGHAVFLGIDSPLSQAQGLALDGPVAESELERMEAFFGERSASTQVEVSSLADPSFISTLSRRGYLIAEQTHMLVSPPSLWAEKGLASEASTLKASVEIVQVEREALEPWVDVVLRGFFQRAEDAPVALREGAISMGMVPGVTAWLARIDGRPAGGGSLIIHDGLALICGDGTLPDFRHRGVQTALLRARLAHAASAGCDLAVICTQPGSGSQRNAERQDFRVVYARTMMVRAGIHRDS
jgi:GNAT superfamily N-acetyltransferase